jgi:FtsH-binding integral membrane protein
LKQAWAQKAWFLSMGMLLYAVISATGQFLQMNHPVLAPVFIIILAATACVLLLSVLVKE